jgi:hypothetical protein
MRKSSKKSLSRAINKLKPLLNQAPPASPPADELASLFAMTNHLHEATPYNPTVLGLQAQLRDVASEHPTHEALCMQLARMLAWMKGHMETHKHCENWQGPLGQFHELIRLANMEQVQSQNNHAKADLLKRLPLRLSQVVVSQDVHPMLEEVRQELVFFLLFCLCLALAFLENVYH